jgi:hypothetical protein
MPRARSGELGRPRVAEKDAAEAAVVVELREWPMVETAAGAAGRATMVRRRLHRSCAQVCDCAATELIALITLGELERTNHMYQAPGIYLLLLRV